MRLIITIYATLMPVALAGIMNMLFTKTALYKWHNAPIDGGRLMRDGKRILGDNKTRNGFLGMTAAGAAAQVMWGAVCSLFPAVGAENILYEGLPNELPVNICFGLCLGLAYALAELPNSFIKRRIGIEEGKTGHGAVGILFFFIDQTDSILGVVLCLSAVCHISLWEYPVYLMAGAFTHIAVNLALFKAHIRHDL